MSAAGDGRGIVTAIDEGTGEVRWATALDGSGTYRRADDERSVDPGWIPRRGRAIEVVGVTRTRRDHRAAAADGLVVVADGLDLGSGVPRLHAFAAGDGTPAWSAPYASPTGIRMYIVAVAAGRVFVHGADGHAYAVRTSDGQLDWTAATAAGESPNGGYADGFILLTGAGPDVIAMDEPGRERWRSTPEEGSARAPAVIDGHIIMGTDLGLVVSLAAAAE